ncbi:MAG: alkaline phosphatase family protein [Actinomycetota bacterium]
MRPYLLVMLVLLVLVAGIILFFRNDPDGSARAPRAGVTTADGLVRHACKLDRKQLLRVWRGQAGDRSPEVVVVPKEPNYFGSFSVPNHSGPAQFLQEVPLVLYGPGRIAARGLVTDRHASITDVYPTVGELTNVELPQRDGEVLEEALVDGTVGTPRLVLTIVWDGVGRNVLRRWPDAWPTLKSLERNGTSFENATVGSSPSITPATHASLGTGSFPRTHGVPAIFYRNEEGKVAGALAGMDPSMLEVTTFADEIDKALGNEPLVGMLGWFPWHIPMMGHGKGTPGGDADQMVLIHDPGVVATNEDFYSVPPYEEGFPGFEEHARRVDRSDGLLDDKWMGNELYAPEPGGDLKKDNPAWVGYQTDMLLTTLRREGYGSNDGSPDLFFVNFKIADVVGHRYIMDSPEMEQVLRAQDSALARIIAQLNSTVEDYVVILTADHGHTPSPERTGAWPLSADEVAADVDAHFQVPEGENLVIGSRTAGLYLNRPLASELDVEAEDVAAFLVDYSIQDNWTHGSLPKGYESRGAEPVLSASFARSQLPDIMECAYGSRRPPPTADD